MTSGTLAANSKSGGVFSLHALTVDALGVSKDVAFQVDKTNLVSLRRGMRSDEMQAGVGLSPLNLANVYKISELLRLIHLKQSWRANRFYPWALHERRVAITKCVASAEQKLERNMRVVARFSKPSSKRLNLSLLIHPTRGVESKVDGLPCCETIRRPAIRS